MQPIAVVGMACRFPDAPNLAAYWRNILAARVSFTDIGNARWTHEAFYHPSPRELDKTYAKRGAFVSDVEQFAALHFAIPPRRAEVMDPQQRLFLEIVRDAIDDAGLAQRSYDKARTGVFVGASVNEFKDIVTSRHRAIQLGAGDFGHGLAADVAKSTASAVTPSRAFNIAGGLLNMMAATVSQTFDWSGPAYSTDAACASALVAIVQAVDYLRGLPIAAEGAAPLAVAGGVYLNLTPDNLIGFSRIGAISPDNCRPFDEQANGFVMGEGAGVVVLKRLADAQRDGDRIYAVIQNTACNNDGRGDGPMTPRLAGQRALLAAGLQGADVGAVGYVECHGTGTTVGDQTELTALSEIFAPLGTKPRLGSVKANIGHTMSAAGVAGFIRAALAVHHRQLPPQANFTKWSPTLSALGAAFEMSTEASAWVDRTRTATVSSFGFGGTNAFALLGPAPTVAPVKAASQPRLFIWSSDTALSVANSLQAFLDNDFTADASDELLARWSWTTSLGRERSEWTCGVVASTAADLQAKVHKALAALALNKASVSEGWFVASRTQLGKVAFLYPGQGAQGSNIFRDLYQHDATYRAALNRLCESAERSDLLGLLYPANDADKAFADKTLTQTEHTQPALAAVELALSEMLTALGATPDVVIGHSLGEFVALAVSKRLTATDTLRFVKTRGQAMAAVKAEAPHGLMAVKADRTQTAALAERFSLYVSNVNHPEQTVLAGTVPVLEKAAAELKSEGIAATLLKVSHAFHSPLVRDAVPTIQQALLQLRLSAATVSHISAVSAAAFPTDDALALALMSEHTLAPVDFLGALHTAFADGVRTFVQVGPGHALTQCVNKTFGKDVLSYSLGSHESTGWLLAVGLCAAAGRRISLPDTVVRVADLAPVVLDRQRYWPVSEAIHQQEHTVTAQHTQPNTLSTAQSEAIRLLDTQMKLMHEQTALIRGLLGAQAPIANATPLAAAPATVVAPTLSAAPVAPVSAVTPAATDDFVRKMISKISAFPMEALRDDMKLGEELGFDSLMIVELATAIRDQLPGSLEVPRELWASQPSIRSLMEFVRSQGAASPAPLQATPAPVARAEPLKWFAPMQEHLPTVTHAPQTLAEASAAILRQPSDADVRTFLATRPSALVWVTASEPAAEREVVIGKALSLAQEHPATKVRVLVAKDVQAPFIASAAASLLASAHRLGFAHKTGVAAEGFSEVATPAASTSELGPKDVVLVTGGSGALAEDLLPALVSSGARIALLGRRPASLLTPAVQAALSEHVQYFVSVAAVIEKFGAITAVVHAAGTTHDVSFEKAASPKAQTATHEVFSAKTEALEALQKLGQKPRFIVTLSSWAAAFGNHSQAHYAAANRAAEHLASTLANRALALRLPPVEGTKMVATIPPVIKGELERAGVVFADRQSIASVIAEAMNSSAQGVFVLGAALPPGVVQLKQDVQQFSISLESHRYLVDHQIHGVPTLPMASALDLFALKEGLQIPFSLANVEVHEGLPVSSSVAVTLEARGTQRTLWSDDKGTPRRAFTADMISLAKKPALSEDEQGWRAPTLPLVEFYRRYTFHGESLRGIQSVLRVADAAIEGTVAISTRRGIEGGSDAPWKVDPLVIDSAFQLALYWAQTERGRAALPMRVGEITMLKPFSGSHVRARLDLEAVNDNDFGGMIRLFDEQGELVAFLRDVKGKLLPSRIFGRRGEEALKQKSEVPEEYYRVEAMPAYLDLRQRLDLAEMSGLKNPYFTLHETVTNNRSTIGGRELINFSSYNYLGLSGDKRVTVAAQKALDQYGTSVSASRIASGEKPLHRELEKKIAAFVGTEDSIVYVGGYVTNVTTIGHMFGPGDLVLHDSLIHDSILQGIKLSGAARRPFPHNDPVALDRTLTMLRGHYKRVLVVIEGTYSMDGDLPDLPAFVKLRDRHKVFLMVDEAHSIGVLGKTGRGVGEHFNIDRSKVDLWMGTLSKSLASCGGYIAGSAALVEYLKYTAPGFVYSVGIPPPNAAASLRAIELIEQEPERVSTLHARSKFFLDCCRAEGLDTGMSKDSAVVPVIVGNSFLCIQLAHRLFEQGINVNPIIYPAVEDNAARLRFFITSLHEEAELAFTAKKVAQTLAELRADEAGASGTEASVP